MIVTCAERVENSCDWHWVGTVGARYCRRTADNRSTEGEKLHSFWKEKNTTESDHMTLGLHWGISCYPQHAESQLWTCSVTKPQYWLRSCQHFQWILWNCERVGRPERSVLLWARRLTRESALFWEHSPPRKLQCHSQFRPSVVSTLQWRFEKEIVINRSSTVTFLGSCPSGSCITESARPNQFLTCLNLNMILLYECMTIFICLYKRWPEFDDPANVDDIINKSVGTCTEHSRFCTFTKEVGWCGVQSMS